MSRLSYFVEKALDSLRQSPGVSLLTTGTICASLLILGTYVLVLQNLESLALVWGRHAGVSVTIDQHSPPENWPLLTQRLAELEPVAHAELLEPSTALERFRQSDPMAAALVAGVSEDILPAVIELDLRGGFANLKALEALAQKLQSIAGVAEVDYGQQEFEQLGSLLDGLRMLGLLVGLFVGVATILIVSNTIRLTVFARRDEISIVSLVGGTPGFVRTPFIIEGALWGILGGSIAMLLLWLSHHGLAPQLSAAVSEVVGGIRLHLFSPSLAMGLLLGGLLLGTLGSTLALSRFLGQQEP